MSGAVPVQPVREQLSPGNPCCGPCCPPNGLGIADPDSSCLRAWCQHFAQGTCSDSSSHSVSCHGAWGREAVFHCVNLWKDPSRTLFTVTPWIEGSVLYLVQYTQPPQVIGTLIT